MKNKNIILLVITILIAFVCVSFAGVYTFTQAAYNEKGCDWANIDHIELRTASGIPRTTSCKCSYSTSTSIKTSTFMLNSKTLDVSAFIEDNNYKLYTKDSDMKIEDLIANEPNRASIAKKKTLYFRSDETEDDSYRMLFDAEAGKLWVSIHYKK
ncbi:MAG TPA: hypothetical protein VGB44_08665 [Flavobacterium sp.]|jgi:hypothetical protein